MIVCPLCEHQQAQGSECEVCGRKFAPGVARELPVERVPGLELTELEGARSVSVPVEPVPELEGTRLRAGPDLPVQRVPDLDSARQEVGPVPVARLPDVEHHRVEANPTERTQLPAVTVCRYCRNQQATGAFCDRCGMRLQRVGAAAASAQPPDAPRPSAEPGPVVMHACGVKTRANARCTSCGGFVPMPE